MIRIDTAPKDFKIRTLPADSLAIISGIVDNCIDDCLSATYASYGNSTTPISGWGGTAESNIRPPASMAFGFAVAVATGLTASSGEVAPRAQAIRLATSLAATHKGNSPGGWGGNSAAGGITPTDVNPEWQGAYWVALAALAAKLLWPDLTTEQRELIENMIIVEANRFIEYVVPSYRSRAGSVNTVGDSKSEENGWNCWVLFIAAGMLPGHVNAMTWRTKALEMVLSSAATPAAPTSRRVLNGLTLGHTLTGSNVEMEGYAVNHGFRSPNYTSIIHQGWLIGLIYAWLVDGDIPASALYNGDLVYRSLTDHQIGVQTTYTPGSHVIYYPDSDEGDPTRMNAFSTFDAMAHIAGVDGLATTPALTWLGLHGNRQLVMQSTDATRRRWYDIQVGANALLGHWIAATKDPRVSNRDMT